MLVHLKSDLIRQRIHHQLFMQKSLLFLHLRNWSILLFLMLIITLRATWLCLTRRTIMLLIQFLHLLSQAWPDFFLSRYYVFFFIYFLLFPLCLSYFSCIYSFSYANLISFVSKLYFFLFNPFYRLLLIKIMHHLHYLKGYIISCSLPYFFLSSIFISEFVLCNIIHFSNLRTLPFCFIRLQLWCKL